MRMFLKILIALLTLILFGGLFSMLNSKNEALEMEQTAEADLLNADELQKIPSTDGADVGFEREKHICLSGNKQSLDPEYFKSCLIAAETGDVEMQYILATSYAIGLGTDIDKSQAAFWYEKAAEQGHNSAKVIIQLYYDQGIGVQRDYVLSYAWLSSVEITSDLPATVLELIEKKDELWQQRLTEKGFKEAQELAEEFKRAYTSQ